MAFTLILSFLILPALAIQLQFFNKNLWKIESLIISFFYYIVLVAAISALTPSNFAVTKYFAILILSFSLGIIFINIKIFKVNILHYQSLISFLILILIYAYCDLLDLRYHASPDNHGFAATVGFLKENFSSNYLAEKYQEITGYYRPVFDGPGGENNGMTWSIADSQLRWASETILTVGRIGLPLLGGIVASISNPLLSFPKFIILLGIFGSYCSAYLILEIFLSSYNAICAKKISVSSKYEVLIIIILALSNWQVIYVLEGTVNQLWLIIAIQMEFLLILKIFTNKDFQGRTYKEKFLYLVGPPLFISVIYPHGFLLLFALSFPLILFIWFGNNRKGDAITVFISLLGCFPFAVYLLNYDTFVAPLKMYSRGAGGAAYFLGTPSIFSYFIGAPYAWYPNNIFKFDLTGQSLLTMKLAASLFTFIVVFVLGLNYRIIKGSRKYFYGLSFIVILLTLVIIKSVFSLNFSEYIYSRHCVVFSAIGLPIVLAFICNLISELKLIRGSVNLLRVKKLFLIITLVTFLSLLSDFYKFSAVFNSNSKTFNVIKSTKELQDIKISEAIIVSEKPMHDIFSLTLFSPIYYLTDDWLPVIKKKYFDSEDIDVYNASMSEGYLKLKKIGSIKLSEDITGPITTNQIQLMKNFLEEAR